MARLVLAATLSANYGIYGPAFELLEHGRASRAARNISTRRSTSSATGTSTRPDSLAAVHRARQRRAARQPGAAARRRPRLPPDRQRRADLLRQGRSDDGENAVRRGRQPRSAPHAVGLGDARSRPRSGSTRDRAFQVHDVLTGARFLWSGARNFVRARSGARAGARVPRCAGACAPSATSTTFSNAWRTRARGIDETAPAARRGTRARATLPATRTGTRTRSSTSCTSRRSSTPTTTASATSAA